MPHYKDTNGKLHFLDDARFEYLLPAGSVPITDEEAAQSIAAASVPESVTMRQARLALLAAGALASVDAAVAAAGDAAKIEWEFAQEVRRDWPLVNQLTAALGWTSEQVDALFIAAEKL